MGKYQEKSTLGQSVKIKGDKIIITNKLNIRITNSDGSKKIVVDVMELSVDDWNRALKISVNPLAGTRKLLLAKNRETRPANFDLYGPADPYIGRIIEEQQKQIFKEFEIHLA